jgi:hypothetical protein
MTAFAPTFSAGTRTDAITRLEQVSRLLETLDLPPGDRYELLREMRRAVGEVNDLADAAGLLSLELGRAPDEQAMADWQVGVGSRPMSAMRRALDQVKRKAR